MKRCDRCGSSLIGPITGIFWLADRVPHSVSFNCMCGTTRAIEWASTTEDIRREAMIAEMSRLAIEGAI